MKPIKRRKIDSVIVLDVANLAYQCFWASNKYYTWNKNKDKPIINTLVIHQMLLKILSLYEWYKPNQILAVFEGDKKNNPRFKNPVYKSNRPSNDSVDLTQEIILFKNIITLMGLLVITPDKGEADDGIGHVVKKLYKKSRRVYIVSKDHDMKFLLQYKNVRILYKFPGDKHYIRRYKHIDFLREFKFEPELFSLFLAVTGDTSDNIPGIKGIGEKTGIKLFQKMMDNNIEININNIAKTIYESKKVRLTQQTIKEQIETWYKLTQLHTDWPICIATTCIYPEKIEEAFIKLNFKTILKSKEKFLEMCTHLSNNSGIVMKSIVKSVVV